MRRWCSTRRAAWANPPSPATSRRSAPPRLRTLVVDLDPQGNSTHYLLGNAAPTNADDTLAGLFGQPCPSSSAPRRPPEFVRRRPSPTCRSCPPPTLEELQANSNPLQDLQAATLSMSSPDFDAVFIDTHGLKLLYPLGADRHPAA